MLKWPLIGLVKFYRLFISPMLGPRCRFHPTCSEYALIALQRYGAFKGTWLAARRISKCHPWNPGGFDPVPEKSGIKGGDTQESANCCNDLHKDHTHD